MRTNQEECSGMLSSGYDPAIQSGIHRGCDCLCGQGKGKKDTRVGGRLIGKKGSTEIEER